MLLSGFNTSLGKQSITSMVLKRYLNLVVIFALVLTCTVGLRAQSMSDWDNVSKIARGSKVIVQLETGKSLRGNIESVSDSEITVLAKNQREIALKADVIRVFLLTDRKSSKSIILGSAVGAAVGVAGVVAIDSTDDRSGVASEAYLLPAIGAGIGALVGSLFRRKTSKQLIYEN